MNNLQNTSCTTKEREVKTMKTTRRLFSTFQLFNLSTLLVAALCAATSRAEMGAGTITRDTKELYGGMIYTVQGDVPVTAAGRTNGLTLKPSGGENGKRVVIDIPEGCSLTVRGGDASPGWRWGAGAGIYVPGDMTLYVTGKDKLTATGGNGSNGEDGSNGSNSSHNSSDSDKIKTGDSGWGGDGGGGAGAGIGGSGGHGSNGGRGVSGAAKW